MQQDWLSYWIGCNAEGLTDLTCMFVAKQRMSITWQPENEDTDRNADNEKNRLYVADERLKHLLVSIIAT